MRSSFDTRHWHEHEGIDARMTSVAAAVVGAGLIGAVGSNIASSNAADQASQSQQAASQAGIAQQNKQFDAVTKLLAPYSNPGAKAFGQQGDLIGLNGAQPQQMAIDAIQNGPQFQSMLQAGNNNILANASATGGLRGGNVQAALGQFSPQLLSQLINEQYNKLGGIAGIGENAAAGVGNAGISTGNNITGLLGQQGAAQAGAALAGGRATGQLINGVVGGIGTLAAQGGFGSGQYTTPNLFGQYSNPAGSSGGITDPYNNLGGAQSAGDFSDIRLKKNIVPIGMTRRGNKLYRWDWKTGGSGMGVIAQEVEHIPGAVSADEDGLLRVDYGKV